MIGVAFIGCGGIMEEHYRHLAGMPDVKMLGHCDVDEARARNVADRFGGDAFTDCKTMLDKVKPEAVYMAVPPFAHGDAEVMAAERGIHLFIEKPLALETRTARRIATAIRKAKVLSSVGYCYRYCDTIALARRLLKGKAVSLVTGYLHGGMPGVWWWRQMNKSGGQVLEQTTHLFDLMRYLCGEVAEVHAMASRGCMTKIKDYDVDDSSAVTMRLKSGATACITSTCVMNNGTKTGLDIVTPEATFRIRPGTLIVHEEGKTTEYRSSVDMYEEENKAFIDAIGNGRRNRIRSTYDDALRTFLLTCAANDSMQTGLPVKP